MEKNKVLSNAFTWLAIGLLICFGVSIITTWNEPMFYMVYGSFGGYGYLLFCLAALIIAIVLSAKIRTLSETTAKILYIIYTMLTGLSLSGIFVIYTASSITFAFLATAIIFAIFAIIGKTTKIDLSKWWVYLFVGLLACIILEIINIFIFNSTLDIILCILVIVVFCGYIAYDVQRAIDDNFLMDCNNKGIYIALQLFVDIINIFLKILRLIGKVRKD